MRHWLYIHTYAVMLADEASLPFFSLIGLICSLDFHNKLVTSFTPVILLILGCCRNDLGLGATATTVRAAS